MMNHTLKHFNNKSTHVSYFYSICVHTYHTYLLSLDLVNVNPIPYDVINQKCIQWASILVSCDSEWWRYQPISWANLELVPANHFLGLEISPSQVASCYFSLDIYGYWVLGIYCFTKLIRNILLILFHFMSRKPKPNFF